MQQPRRREHADGRRAPLLQPDRVPVQHVPRAGRGDDRPEPPQVAEQRAHERVIDRQVAPVEVSRVPETRRGEPVVARRRPRLGDCAVEPRRAEQQRGLQAVDREQLGCGERHPATRGVAEHRHGALLREPSDDRRDVRARSRPRVPSGARSVQRHDHGPAARGGDRAPQRPVLRLRPEQVARRRAGRRRYPEARGGTSRTTGQPSSSVRVTAMPGLGFGLIRRPVAAAADRPVERVRGAPRPARPGHGEERPGRPRAARSSVPPPPRRTVRCDG